ncbi:IclR family transcriptional regulator [Sporomusa acidovorans]|uniref:Transcriptional regulator KdgR n=1 Tax=Sporomusa acidovorans (strain ATCC 49682 / DSM 3132 / Mol) TaxID=1123286 RepID=A0ABZ3IXD3_SPOA4|nr:IclR family transcriptional regulator [Sporomusa acidovorans]OZC23405.1 transcriptional regulator KdgR [Sporomusa acidovorans DSM 3132]SDE44526.1 transcriptional regulator, IclR family [Sporomusa acidovorans]
MDKIKLHNPTLRVLHILEAIYNSVDGLTLAEISRRTGIFKGTLHPIVMTLLHEGFLQNFGSRIVIGKNCFKLGYAYVHSLNYLDILKPHMREIVAACDEICQLGILDGGDVLYVEKTEPNQAIRIESSAGKTIAAYATALGKCLLSGLSNDEIVKLYPNEFIKYTVRTIPDLKMLLQQLEAVRNNGYAHEIGETNIDIECLAVPIKISDKVLASISVSLPIFRSTPKKTEQILAVLKLHAELIAKEIALLPMEVKLFSD